MATDNPSAHVIATKLRETMDGVPEGACKPIGWVAENTGVEENVLIAFIMLGSGRGSNWRIGYIDGQKGLVRT